MFGLLVTAWAHVLRITPLPNLCDPRHKCATKRHPSLLIGNAAGKIVRVTSLPVSSPLSAAVCEAHEASVKLGMSTYCDPRTGYEVFTEVALRELGSCCGNRCRHCPYDYEACNP